MTDRRPLPRLIVRLASAVVAAAATSAFAPAARGQTTETEAAIIDCEGGDARACADLYRASGWACGQGSATACELNRRLVRGGYVPSSRYDPADDPRGSEPPPPRPWSDPRGGRSDDDDPCLDPQLRRALREFGYCRG
jgi:hypothetical protein